MAFQFLCASLISVVFLFSSCDKEDESAPGNGKNVKFTQQALGSLPLIASSTNLTTETNISSITTVANIFKYECHMPELDNYCPSTIDVTANNGYNDYKFTTTSLIGLIYTAQMYIGNYFSETGSYKTCEAYNGAEKAVTASSFTGGTNPDKYLIDIYSLYNCIGSTSGAYAAYSKSTDDTYYAALSTRVKVPFNNDTSILQTDIFQPYVSMDGTTPKFLAFNHAGISSMYVRAIVLANLAEHKFAIKYTTTDSSWVVAIGKAGVDHATGNPIEGYYRVKYLSGSTTDELCVNNADGSIQTDGTKCDDASIPWTNWSSSDDVKTFLSISDTDATNIANYLTFFKDNTELASGTYPTAATDADNYFPATIN